MRTSLRGSYHTEHWCAHFSSLLLSTPTISFQCLDVAASIACPTRPSVLQLRDLWVIFSTYPNKSPQASPRVGCASCTRTSMLWLTALQRPPKSLSSQTKLYLLGPGNIASASTTLKTPVASKDSRIQAQVKDTLSPRVLGKVTMHRWNRLMTHSTMCPSGNSPVMMARRVNIRLQPTRGLWLDVDYTV
ncbi:hypothetical protein B0H14DRAFT_2787942 [Mycena olivaceomarginata]|nr:hypothetical protein B0H14DRAFT_2787942 [Mycena olivaceomarginata]